MPNFYITGVTRFVTGLRPQEDSKMNSKKNTKMDGSAVSPVIATILMVAITVVLAAVLAYYVMVSTENTGEAPKFEVQTSVEKQSLDFSVSLQSVTRGEKLWADAALEISSSSGVRQAYSHVTAAASDDTNPSVAIVKGTASAPNWYLKPSGSANATFVKTAPSTILADNAASMPSGIDKVENAYFTVLDNNADGKLSAGDVMRVYGDSNNDDGSIEVPTGSILRIKIGQDTIADIRLN